MTEEVVDLFSDGPDVSLTLAAGTYLEKKEGQGEEVYTDRAVNTYTEVPAPPSDPKNMSAFQYGGFDVITLAGNHIWVQSLPALKTPLGCLMITASPIPAPA